MRQLYIKKWCKTATTAPSLYVLSDRIKPGWILHVHNCYAHAPERDTSEIIMLGVRNGEGDILIRSRGGAIAKEGMSALNDFFVGEGDQIFAYFPSATGTESIELHVVGCLITLDEYREKGE